MGPGFRPVPALLPAAPPPYSAARFCTATGIGIMAVADELRGKYVDEIEVGATAVFSKTVTEADIVFYAGVSGDTNPVHLDESFAKGTMFKGFSLSTAVAVTRATALSPIFTGALKRRSWRR